MARLEDTVKQAVNEIQQLLKEIKASDEDDLGKLTGAFYEISLAAVQTGHRLNRADQALSGEGADEDEDEERDEDAEQDQQQDEQQQQAKAAAGGNKKK